MTPEEAPRTMNQCSMSPPLLDQIPTPDVIVRRLGETITERRILRALLKVAKLKQQVTNQGATQVQNRQGVAGV